MNELLLPTDVYAYLGAKTLGQDEVLRKVSVAVYKHINGLKAGNLLLIGNSGTGKTTVMNSIRKFYYDHDHLKKYKAMTIMNANMLMGEDTGDVNLTRLIKSLEIAVYNTFGSFVTDEKLKEYMENATVCIDEIDKISANVAGKVNVTGISIQHALLTLIEGERVLFETTRDATSKQKKTRLTVDTSKMLFICGGAFEGLFDQILGKINAGTDDRKLEEVTYFDPEGKPHTERKLVLREQLRLEDLFAYGMSPQFISRFKSIGVLEDLGVEELKKIMLTADDSPLRYSMRYFKSMGIDLRITKDALDLIAYHAVRNTRIGARALSEVFSKIVDNLEFDPSQSDKLQEVENGLKALTIDKEVALRHLV